MKAVVLGGAGFIGSHLVDALLKLNVEVTVVDNLSNGHLDNLKQCYDKIKFIKGDIRDENVLKKAMKKADYAFLLAAKASVPKSWAFPGDFYNVNIEGTHKVLQIAQDMKVKRVIFSSSSSVYGDQSPGSPKVETMEPRPISPYALSKRAGELLMKMFAKVSDVDTVCLRYFNVYGSRQRFDSPYAAAIPKFCMCALKNEAPIIYGDGEQSRDFTMVDNVVDGNIKAALCKEALNGEIINIAGGTPITVNKLWNGIKKMAAAKVDPKYEAERKGDIKHSDANPAKAERYIGWKMKVGLKEGMKRTLDYYKSLGDKNG